MYTINYRNPGQHIFPKYFNRIYSTPTHTTPTQPLYMPPIFVPPAPLPGTVGMFPGVQYMIPYELMHTYGPTQGTTIQEYGQPIPIMLQSLPKYPPYYQTPPHFVPAQQPGEPWLEKIGQYLPPVEQLFGH